jgi:hypothetical protein
MLARINRDLAVTESVSQADRQRKAFTKPLSRNERLFWFHYFGFLRGTCRQTESKVYK